MTAVGATRLVAAREIRETTRRKSFWIVLVVLALAATAAVVVPTLLDDDGTRYRVAVVGDRPGLAEALTTSLAGLDATVRTSLVTTATDAERSAALGGELPLHRRQLGRLGGGNPAAQRHRLNALRPEHAPSAGEPGGHASGGLRQLQGRAPVAHCRECKAGPTGQAKQGHLRVPRPAHRRRRLYRQQHHPDRGHHHGQAGEPGQAREFQEPASAPLRVHGARLSRLGHVSEGTRTTAGRATGGTDAC